jgi:hypothetical protein
VERLIEQSKDRYYETLEQGSQGWHEGKHNPWPFINYVLWVLKTAYAEFERRVGEVKGIRGEKTEVVLRAIARTVGVFTVGELQDACPGVGVDLIRRLLKRLRERKQLECLGRGRDASLAEDRDVDQRNWVMTN